MKHDSTGVVEDDRGPAAWTGSGFLHILDPRPEEIHLADIARGLSRIARFNGHTTVFYSVAQHSILCEWIARDRGLGVELQRLALMHDATEAYIGDLIRPVKQALPRYQEIEAGIWRAIAARFRLPAEIPAEIKAIDNAALATEKRDLCPGSPSWPGLPAPLFRRVSAGYAPNFTASDFLTVARRLGLS